MVSTSRRRSDGASRRSRRRAPAEPADQDGIDGERAGTDDGDHREDDEVRELVEADEVEDVMQIGQLGGEDRDDHADDERHGSEAREEPQYERRTAEQLAVPDEDGLEMRRGDAERGEEAGHLLDVVDLAPAGRREYQSYRQSSEQRCEPVKLS